MGMPIATDPVTMLPDKLARCAAVATLFLKYGNKVGETTNDTEIVHHDRTVHHR
jgi:hypothetical protein